MEIQLIGIVFQHRLAESVDAAQRRSQVVLETEIKEKASNSLLAARNSRLVRWISSSARLRSIDLTLEAFVRLLHVRLFPFEVLEDIQYGALRAFELFFLLGKIVQDVQEGMLELFKLGFLGREVFEDIQYRALRAGHACFLRVEILEDVERSALTALQFALFRGEVLQNVQRSAMGILDLQLPIRSPVALAVPADRWLIGV